MTPKLHVELGKEKGHAVLHEGFGPQPPSHHSRCQPPWPPRLRVGRMALHPSAAAERWTPPCRCLLLGRDTPSCCLADPRQAALSGCVRQQGLLLPIGAASCRRVSDGRLALQPSADDSPPLPGPVSGLLLRWRTAGCMLRWAKLHAVLMAKQAWSSDPASRSSVTKLTRADATVCCCVRASISNGAFCA